MTTPNQTPVKGMPSELVAKGWQLFIGDNMRFRAGNEEKDLSIGPFPSGDEAIDAARREQTRIDLVEEVPADMVEAGWRIEKDELMPLPFRAVNDRLSLDTGGFRYPADALENARELQLEAEERSAVATDGLADDDGSLGANRLFPVELIRTDGGTQPREALDMHVVAEYAEAMRNGAIFPPVKIFYDGTAYWLADGFHRVQATKDAELEEIHADIDRGTQRDALLYSLGANATHGLPRSREDKRRAVLTMLNDSEWAQFSDNLIAQKTATSQPFVSKIRRELSQNVLSEGDATQPAQPTKRKGADGVLRETAKIGARDASDEEIDARQTTLADIDGVKIPERRPDDFEESSPEELAAQSQRHEVAGEWSVDDIVTAIRKNGGSMFRGQLEELGCTYAAILNALHEERITQPEVGKYQIDAVVGAASQAEAESGKSAGTAAKAGENAGSSVGARPSTSAPVKARPPIDELLNGGMLSVAFTWIPGLKGKVQCTVNASTDNMKATRVMLEASDVPAMGEKVREMIVAQVKGVKGAKKNGHHAPAKKPATRKAAPAKRPSGKKSAAKNPAARKPSKRSAAKGRKR